MRRRVLVACSGLAGVALMAGMWCCGAALRTDGGHGLLPVGVEVPDLATSDHRGQRIALRQIVRDRQLLVFFYPKDSTPGCTKEACALRDAWTKYERAGIVVVGVSADSVEDHEQFAGEYQLPFSLVADADGAWARAFGVGSTLGMYSRVSFLVARGGKLRRVYDDVDPSAHADEVLKDALP